MRGQKQERAEEAAQQKRPLKAKLDYIKQTGAVRVTLKCFLTQKAINQGAHTLFALMVAAFSMR